MTKVLVASIKGPKGDTGDITPALVEARDTATAAAADAALSRDAAAVSADQAASAAADAVADADIPGQVSAGITDSPTVTAAAQAAAVTAVDAEVSGRDLVEGEQRDQTGLAVAITDEKGNRTWLEANDADGGPTLEALDLLDAVAPLPRVGDLQGIAAAVVVDGHRTWLQVSSVDGGPTPETIEWLTDALETDILFTADGDSMTQGGHGGGTPARYTDTLAALLGKPVTNRGLSGRTAQEVEIALGVVQLLTIAGDGLPATTASVTVTLTNNGPWSSSGQPNRTYTGTVRGVPVVLTYTTSTGVWSLARVTAGAAVAMASPVAFVPTGPDLDPRVLHIIWAGRNNSPKSTAKPAVDRMVKRLAPDARFLIVSILNSTSEASGSADYTALIAANAALQAEYPFEYVDLRGRLIREGLGIAGITATAADLTAISEDRIPPSLMADTLHLNAAGRLAAGTIVHDELKIRSYA